MITIFTIIATLQFSCVNSPQTVESAEAEETIQEVGSFETVAQKEMDTVVNIEEKAIEKVKKVSKVAEKELKVDEVKIDQVKKTEEKEKVEEVIAAEETVVKIEKEEVIVEEEAAEEVEPVVPEVAKEEEVIIAKPDHGAFDALLSTHVSSKGVVNYKGLKGDIRKLDAYLKDLDENAIASDWSRDEKLAYWINTYNAFTIKLILDNYPVNSIQDIAGGKPWDKKWIKLDGKTYSLNQIENDIIRPEFKEPRIHFAVNCAAQSCPPLANKAFTAANLNSLLEKQTKAFVNNSKYNKISANSANVSKIFDWYGVDFGDKLAFLNKYSATKIAGGTNITYTDYDWGLNNK